MKHQLKPMSYGRGNVVSVERTTSLAAYLDMINKFLPLSAEKEAELGWLAMAGDEEAKAELINCNLRGVVSIVKKQYAYCGGTLSVTDLINEGNVGLIIAAESFDPTRGIRFMSYAVGHIRRYIIDALTNKSRIVSDYHRTASLTHSSLDAPAVGNDNDDDTLGETICISNDTDNLAEQSLYHDIQRVLNSLLNDNEYYVICSAYGIGTQKMDNREIAEKMDRTEERIRQIKNYAINKIKHSANAIRLLAKYI